MPMNHSNNRKGTIAPKVHEWPTYLAVTNSSLIGLKVHFTGNLENYLEMVKSWISQETLQWILY